MYKIILPFRYLIKRRITALAVFAVALCVFMVAVVMTVMTGLVRDFKLKNHDWVGDCLVTTDSLVGFPCYEDFIQVLRSRFAGFEAASPVVRTYGLLTYDLHDYNRTVEIMGFDPEKHCKVTNFGRTLYYHKDDCHNAFKPSYDANLPGCVLGIDIALNRDDQGQYYHTLRPSPSSFSVNCFPLTPKGALARAGLGLVNSKIFYYSDDSRSRLAKVDGAFIFLPLADAQSLAGMNGPRKRISAVHIKVKPGLSLEQATDKVARLWTDFVATMAAHPQAELLKNVTVQSWKTYSRETIAAVEKEQVMMILAFGMIGIITVFIVFVVLYMIVSHKTKDIGILKSIGAANLGIAELFLGFAFLVGLLGSAIGTAAAVLFLAKINLIEKWLYEHYGFQLWNRMIYVIDEIPNKIEFDTLAIIIIAAIAACLTGALIPSLHASRLKPVETLQVSQL